MVDNQNIDNETTHEFEPVDPDQTVDITPTTVGAVALIPEHPNGQFSSLVIIPGLY